MVRYKVGGNITDEAGIRRNSSVDSDTVADVNAPYLGQANGFLLLASTNYLAAEAALSQSAQASSICTAI